MDQDDLPPVSPDLDSLRKELFRLYELRKEGGQPPILEIEDSGFLEALTGGFEELLRVVLDCRRQSTGREKEEVPELTMRSGFDRLTRLYFDGESKDSVVNRMSV